MNLDKKFFILFFLAIPIVFVVIFSLWGKFYLNESIWINLQKGFEISTLYYFGLSLVWIINFDSIKKLNEKK